MGGPPPRSTSGDVNYLCEYYYLQRKEGNVLFNDALNTFYLWLYGVGYMVKDIERGNLQSPLHGQLFPIREQDVALW